MARIIDDLENLDLEIELSQSELDKLPVSDTMTVYMRELTRTALLTGKEEKILTEQIFADKLSVLVGVAQDPAFIEYLKLMVEVATKAVNNNEPEKESRKFTAYLNSGSSKSANPASLEVFLKDIRELIRLCRTLQAVSTEKGLDAAKRKVIGKLEEINFSWVQLEEDGLFELADKESVEWLRLRENVKKMTVANLRLALSVAKKFSRHPHFLDAVQEANGALMKAVLKFDPRMGFKFSTYATWWLRQQTQRFLSQFVIIRIPVHLQDKIYKATKARDQHPDWDDQQLARHLNMPVKKLKTLLQTSEQARVTYMDEPSRSVKDESDGDSLTSRIPDPTVDIEGDVLDLITNEQMLSVMKERLTPREFEVVTRRLGLIDGEEQTLDEIGVSFRVSRERIRQVQVKALKKLKSTKFFRQLWQSNKHSPA